LRFPNGPRPTKQTFDKPFGHTIMAGGSNDNVHPDGWRRYTLREIACIQTFPIDYQFVGCDTKVKRLIGNAVPPMMGKALLKQVRKALEESDAEDARDWANADSASRSGNEATEMDEVVCTGHAVLPPNIPNSSGDPVVIEDEPVVTNEDEPVVTNEDDEMEGVENAETDDQVKYSSVLDLTPPPLFPTPPRSITPQSLFSTPRPLFPAPRPLFWTPTPRSITPQSLFLMPLSRSIPPTLEDVILIEDDEEMEDEMGVMANLIVIDDD
jgi:hypothetical protein